MSKIQISDLTFEYDGADKKIFNNVSLVLDTDWKLGLIGRNGRGKTTFLELLLGKHKFLGSITKSVDFDYFPFQVQDKKRLTISIIEEIIPHSQEWEIMRELNLLNASPDVLYREFNTLSGGEQVKVLLVSLFLKENNFLLIDEPTNHLDVESINHIQKYLENKKGYIMVSHNRDFLDNTVDHILSINNASIEITKGNFSVWKENFDRKNNFEIKKNEKLEQEVKKLEKASKTTSNWSNKVEQTKYGLGPVDRGYIGHKAAKMMKTSKAIEKRKQNTVDEKKTLIQNVERVDILTIKPLVYKKNPILYAKDLSIKYNDKEIFNPISFELNVGDRIAITGKNGSGKSSLLKLIMDENIEYSGNFLKGTDIKISYVPQSTSYLKGMLNEYANLLKVDEGIFKAMLFKLGVLSNEFNKDMSSFSEGQKKKILIARSISESAGLYIWDEPLNFIDLQSRMQIEEAILKYKPTMIFVDHDDTFTKKIATKYINLEIYK